MVISVAFLFAMTMLAFIFHQDVHAVSLKVAPLEYRTTLGRGESKKGFVDISNPTGSTLRIKTSAQAFRQVDDAGGIQFYSSEQVSAGVKLDLNEFDLGPRQALRMYFILDGTKLPSGDVFAAIFFSTVPTGSGVTQSLRVGTLLSVTNGTPGARTAIISGVELPFLSLSDRIEGSYVIKNTGNPETETGFYPDVSIDVDPFTEDQKQQGKLVFAGRSRTNQFVVSTHPIGLYRVNVMHAGQGLTRYVFVMTPPAILALVFGLLALLLGYRTYRRAHRKSPPPTSV